MTSAQILIKCGENCFGFTKSKTGQLDYVGLLQKDDVPSTENYQELASSTYFSASYYRYLADELCSGAKIYVENGIDISDKDTFAFLTHVGALLQAVFAKDSLLAGELYMRRKDVFERFAPLTQYILEPLCVEILFSLVYGRMNNCNADEIPLIFTRAKKKLMFDASKESLEQAFMRYFVQNDVALTLAVVGTSFYNWDGSSDLIDNMANNLCADDLLGQAQKIRSAKHNFYASLETVVQAEPNNKSDKNAIVVFIENIDAKILGNPGLQKCGYVRALGAKIIRETKPEKIAYKAKLARLSDRDIVVQVTI